MRAYWTWTQGGFHNKEIRDLEEHLEHGPGHAEP